MQVNGTSVHEYHFGQFLNENNKEGCKNCLKKKNIKKINGCIIKKLK